MENVVVWRSRISLAVVVAALAVGVSVSARQETDADRFAQGRVALDKYKDCPAALHALTSVSPASRSEPLWILYVAKTYDCLDRLPEAIDYYAKYAAVFPGQSEVTEKLADLRYRATKQKAEKDRREAVAAEEAATRAAVAERFRPLMASWTQSEKPRSSMRACKLVTGDIHRTLQFSADDLRDSELIGEYTINNSAEFAQRLLSELAGETCTETSYSFTAEYRATVTIDRLQRFRMTTTRLSCRGDCGDVSSGNTFTLRPSGSSLSRVESDGTVMTFRSK